MTQPESLLALVERTGHLPVIPLMGFPGMQLNRTSLKQNVFNWGVQFWTVYELAMRFQPDGMFPLMDLSIEANALGLPVRFPINESPSVEEPVVRSKSDLTRFFSVDVLKDGRVAVAVETVRLMAQHVGSLIGAYVIGPYTLAALMLGATEAAMATLDDGDLLHETLAFCQHVTGRYAAALVGAGAQVLAVLEPSATMLSPRQFGEYSGRYVSQLIAPLPIPSILHICGDSSHLIDGMVATGAQGLSLDSMVDLPTIAQHIPGDVVLVGNISPTAVMVDMPPAAVYGETRVLVEAMQPHRNFILSTGCDLPLETPLENIAAFCKAARDYRRQELYYKVASAV
jgi:uroporphyrinogen decarboxylase